jgi:hypothetical protein
MVSAATFGTPARLQQLRIAESNRYVPRARYRPGFPGLASLDDRRITPVSYMKCNHARELYRSRRRWWERLIGVKRAARCAACGHRVWFFRDAAPSQSEPRALGTR